MAFVMGKRQTMALTFEQRQAVRARFAALVGSVGSTVATYKLIADELRAQGVRVSTKTLGKYVRG